MKTDQKFSCKNEARPQYSILRDQPGVTYNPTRWHEFMTYLAEHGRTPDEPSVARNRVDMR